MHDDDNALAGIDLAAWQPPAPPAGTADAVIARLREPASVPASVSAIDLRDRPSRRTWWIGGATLVAAAIVALAAWGLTRTPRNGHDEVVATRARHLELDGSTADLDAGAELRWDRDRHRLSVHQARGAVRWTIADDDTLVIEPGGPGSTATIEASGASLGVEVQMNLSDMRLLGATTLTAAAVAVVTVVVYAGHVQATSAGQTVNVTPGATIELRPERPPEEPALRQPDEPWEPIAVGAGPIDVQQLEEQLRVADEKIAALTAELAARTVGRSADPAVAPHPISPITLEASRLSGEKIILPDADTKLAIAKAGATKIFGTFKLCVDTSGTISSLRPVKSTGFETYDQTIEQAIHDWKFKPFLVDGKPTPVCTAVTFIYRQDEPKPDVDRTTVKHDSSTAPPTMCATMDVDDLMTAAKNQFMAGYANAALSVMTKALQCKQSVQMYRFAATYACAAHEAATARTLFAKVPPQFQAAIEQKCVQEGIAVRSP